MHLLLPYASAISPICKHALQGVALPHLQALLSELKLGERNEGNEWSLSSPHERILAQELGYAGADGALPWAAWQAEQDQIAPLDLAWGLLTPLHWQLGRDHLTVLPPSVLKLSEEHSRALFDAALPLFTSEGWALHWATATRWYVAHESLAELPTASLDRVVGRNPDQWLPDHASARIIKRLQNEVQMLWYTHPANDAREAQGLPAINTVWLSGCGRHQKPQAPSPSIINTLRDPLWLGDWHAWAQAWRDVDAGPLKALLHQARQGQRVALTLAGERHAQTWDGNGSNWFTQLRARFTQADALGILSSL
jgi:hypothetical protein